MVTHVGLDGRWLKVPPTLCDLLGYREDELLARYLKDVTHPDDFEGDWSQHQRIIHGEIKSFELEKRYLHRDGHIVWIYLNCSVVADTHGRPIHFLTYIRDITERKQAQEALRERRALSRHGRHRPGSDLAVGYGQVLHLCQPALVGIDRQNVRAGARQRLGRRGAPG